MAAIADAQVLFPALGDGDMPPAWELTQSWLAQPARGFAPGRVHVAWWDDALHLAAVLQDADIHNPQQAFNASHFLAGDTFEVFVRVLGQSAYYEFHVTPTNARLQLRIASAAAFRDPRAGAVAKLDDPDLITSRTAIAADRWLVRCSIPFALCAEGLPVTSGSLIALSCSRYDYTRGEPAPVLSSTSPHRVLDFHRQEEWRRLRLE